MKHQESELFFRYHRGLCTKAEKDEVEKLLNGSEAYRLQFLDSKIAWALGEDIKLMEAVDAELGYKKIKADIRAKKLEYFKRDWLGMPLFDHPAITFFYGAGVFVF